MSVAICSEGGNIELLITVGTDNTCSSGPLRLLPRVEHYYCHYSVEDLFLAILACSVLFKLMLAAFVILDNENSVTGWSIYQCCLCV